MMSLVLMAGFMSGCAKSSTTPSSSPQASPAAKAESQAEAPKAEAVKWPSGTTTIYSATKAGNASDIYARVLTPVLQEKSGENFVVMNQADGGGVVAYETVRNSKPDGNSLLYYLNTMLVQYYTGVYEVNPVEEFTTISVIQVSSGMHVVVKADSKYQSMQDIIDDVKANPGAVKFGMTSGQALHLIAGMMEQDIGSTLTRVDAGGNNERLISLLGGHVDFTMVSTAAAQQYVDSGEVRVLGCVTGTGERDPEYPDVPNVVELGLPKTLYGFDSIVMGPKGMDAALVESINQAFIDVHNDPTVVEQYGAMKFKTNVLNVEDSKKYMQDFAATIGPLAKSLGFGA